MRHHFSDTSLLSWLLIGILSLFPTVTIGEEYLEYDAFSWNHALERGINIGNSLEVVESDKWKIEFGPDYIAKIAEAGFTSIRIPIRWSVYAQDTYPYTIDPAIFNEVDRLIELGFEHDLTVVINVHHYRALMQEPKAERERFLAIWQQLSDHYLGYPQKLYFELLNEPSKQLWADVWNELLLEALSVVREKHPDRAVLIGPARFNSLEQLSRLKLPKDDANIIASFHYYQPLKFTHQGADWVFDYDESWEGGQWAGSVEQEREIIKHFDLAVRWAKENKVPLNMGEFGVYWKADDESRYRWTKFVRSEAEKRNISWTYWSFGAGFGVYDTKGERWRTELLQALLSD